MKKYPWYSENCRTLHNTGFKSKRAKKGTGSVKGDRLLFRFLKKLPVPFYGACPEKTRKRGTGTNSHFINYILAISGKGTHLFEECPQCMARTKE
jgi:hypothetical protein